QAGVSLGHGRLSGKGCWFLSPLQGCVFFRACSPSPSLAAIAFSLSAGLLAARVLRLSLPLPLSLPLLLLRLARLLPGSAARLLGRRRGLVVEVRERHSRQTLADLPFDACQRRFFFARHQDERVAGCTGASCAANAVNVIFRHVRHVCADDVRDVV